MRVNNSGKKRYYIYQNDKYIGKVTKKKDELTVNNNSPFYIRKTNKIFEIVYYVVLIGLVGLFSWCARPLLLVLFMMGAYIINPFDLTRKTDYYIPRPTGTITLTDDHNFKTNAEVILRKRGQFLIIRFISLILFFTIFWELLIYDLYWCNGRPIMFLIIPAIYLPIYVLLMIFSIKKFKAAYNAYKLEREEQDKIIKSL